MSLFFTNVTQSPSYQIWTMFSKYIISGCCFYSNPINKWAQSSFNLNLTLLWGLGGWWGANQRPLSDNPTIGPFKVKIGLALFKLFVKITLFYSDLTCFIECIFVNYQAAQIYRSGRFLI